MPECKCCHNDKPEDDFPICGTHTKKNGEKKTYRREICRSCFNGDNRLRQREVQRDRIHRLLSWTAPVLLTIVTGIYQFDSVSGRLRTCTYESIYGHHSVTINAMNMCPLTWTFEV
jgi:hypothetical protein